MIEYLTYKKGEKETKIPYRVSYYAIQKTSNEIKERTGMEFSIEDLETADISILESLLYFSIQAGIHFSDSDLKIERDEIIWILDYCMSDFISGLQKFFPDKQPQQSKKEKK
jgi:hypothetical protein